MVPCDLQRYSTLPELSEILRLPLSSAVLYVTGSWGDSVFNASEERGHSKHVCDHWYSMIGAKDRDSETFQANTMDNELSIHLKCSVRPSLQTSKGTSPSAGTLRRRSLEGPIARSKQAKSKHEGRTTECRKDDLSLRWPFSAQS